MKEGQSQELRLKGHCNTKQQHGTDTRAVCSPCNVSLVCTRSSAENHGRDEVAHGGHRGPRGDDRVRSEREARPPVRVLQAHRTYPDSGPHIDLRATLWSLSKYLKIPAVALGCHLCNVCSFWLHVGRGRRGEGCERRPAARCGPDRRRAQLPPRQERRRGRLHLPRLERCRPRRLRGRARGHRYVWVGVKVPQMICQLQLNFRCVLATVPFVWPSVCKLLVSIR